MTFDQPVALGDAPPAPFTSSLLGDAPSISHGFFGRVGGVSTGLYHSLNAGLGSQDDPEAVRENRARTAKALGLRHVDDLVTMHQVHSADVVPVTGPIALDERPKADAMVTDRPGLGLGVLTADCAPILLADPDQRVIGAAHAGWRGARDGVIEASVNAMVDLGARRERIIAAIGPTIGQPSYEVGPEYVARFVEDDAANARHFSPGQGDRSHFDLNGYIEDRLTQAGIQRCEALRVCTHEHEDALFSYRRSVVRGEADYGRNIAVIALTST